MFYLVIFKIMLLVSPGVAAPLGQGFSLPCSRSHPHCILDGWENGWAEGVTWLPQGPPGSRVHV